LDKGVDDDSLERVLFVELINSFDINKNSSIDSGSPSQLMTTSLISGGSQANFSLTSRSRSPSLRRINDHSKI
jgi:hypothetical protein